MYVPDVFDNLLSSSSSLKRFNECAKKLSYLHAFEIVTHASTNIFSVLCPSRGLWAVAITPLECRYEPRTGSEVGFERPDPGFRNSGTRSQFSGIGCVYPEFRIAAAVPRSEATLGSPLLSAMLSPLIINTKGLLFRIFIITP